MTMIYTTVDSPIGALLLCGTADELSGLSMLDGPRPRRIGAQWRRDAAAFPRVRAQLEEYFAGARQEFDVALALRGSEFEQRVWRQLRLIPYGQTRSYGELARALGDPALARAVGVANARNPVAVIVPCHRVVGADGSLTGFGGGLERKRALLDLEAGRLALSV
jgi:methylated-DNA-[protein]-cysteine S-methyltransferase